MSRPSKSKGGAGGSKAKSSGDDEYDPGQGKFYNEPTRNLNHKLL